VKSLAISWWVVVGGCTCSVRAFECVRVTAHTHWLPLEPIGSRSATTHRQLTAGMTLAW
jgi:hypothetical protein